MPYTKTPRPYKHEYQLQKARGEGPARAERQRAREAIDKKHPDRDGDGKADIREGKDVAHVKALSKGGTNGHGVRIESAAKNRSFKRNSNHKLVTETSTKERKKK
jgi:hypothetical protein